jgi:hypothetical protein
VKRNITNCETFQDSSNLNSIFVDVNLAGLLLNEIQQPIVFQQQQQQQHVNVTIRFGVLSSAVKNLSVSLPSLTFI